MNEFPIAISSEHIIDNLIEHINRFNEDIERCNLEKQKSEKQLKELLNHPILDGSKTYKHKSYSIKITTGFNHSLNKEKYEEIKNGIGIKHEFDPVKKVIKYELNKKTIRDCLEFGSSNDKWTISEFITSTEKKLHVTIEAKKNDKNTNVNVAS